MLKKLINELTSIGYTVVKDELPVRMELYSPKYGYIDIHPFEILSSNKKDK